MRLAHDRRPVLARLRRPPADRRTMALARAGWPERAPRLAIAAWLALSVSAVMSVIAGGLALMVLPTLIVGNELLILAGVFGGVALWFLGHRHGHLRGSIVSKS
jgi:hypothetical protein